LTGFVHLPAVMGPAITITTSGNLAKATAQLASILESYQTK